MENYKNQKLFELLDEVSQLVCKKVSFRSLEGSTVSITGASGLVGINIVATLLYYNKNYAKKPIIISAISHSKPYGFFLELTSNNNLNNYYGDITNYEFLNSIPKSDYIIHSAGYAQPGKFMDDKLKTIAINTTSTIALLKKLNTNGSFLFLSSSEVYSGSLNSHSNESDIGSTTPNHPRACYIEGKRTGEAIINAARSNGIKAASARLALAYGPGVNKNDLRVLNQLIEKGIDGKIKLLDSGEAMRTYCYISDVVISLCNILINNKFEVYNVGGESTLSIKDLAIIIGQQMSSPVEIPNTQPFLASAPTSVELDLSRIENEYGMNHYIKLDYGLKKTIDWLRLCN